MPLTLDIMNLEEPLLEFGSGGEHVDPRQGLQEFGPLSLRFGPAHKKQVRIGLVGPQEIIVNARQWFERCRYYISSGQDEKILHPDFPGFEAIFRSSLDLSQDVWEKVFTPDEIEHSLNQPTPTDRFEAALKLYENGIRVLAEGEMAPDLVVVCVSDNILAKCRTLDVPRLSSSERKALKKQQEGNVPLPGFDEVIKVEDRLLHQNFRRALKARAMDIGIPIQIGTDNLFLDQPSNQNPATRAWNVSLALFYKAGGLPWRLKTLAPETCYVGISFNKFRSHQKHMIFPSLAQAFPATGEGFVLRGDAVEIDRNSDDRNPHLSTEQAINLTNSVLREYRARMGTSPLRVVLYKTSKFSEDELVGFREGLSAIPAVEMVNLRPAEFRLLRRGAYPPARGTIAIVNDDTFFLFTNGYYAGWKTYMGPHVPVPYEVSYQGDSDPLQVCTEIMSLTKLNWNTARIFTSTPIPIHFAREVGSIISHYMDLHKGENVRPDPSYRFYM